MNGYTPSFITAKVTDLALVTFYYFSFALVFSIVLQLITRFYEKYTSTPGEKTTTRLFFEIIANIFFIAIAFWIIRNLVERIPFPLDGVGGYEHSRLSTTTTSAIAALTLIMFQTTLTDKIKVLNERMFKKSQKL